MSKNFRAVCAVIIVCVLSLFLLSCGSSSSRPSNILYVLTQATNGTGNNPGYNVTTYGIDLGNGGLSLVNSNASTCPGGSTPQACGPPLDIVIDPTGATAFVLNQGSPTATPPVAPSISAYSVNSDGSLGTGTQAVTLPQDSAENYYQIPVSMMRDPAGTFLFVIMQPQLNNIPTGCPSVATNVAPPPPLSNLGCTEILIYSMTPGSTTLTLAGGSPYYVSRVPTGLSTVVFTPPGASASQELLFVSNNLDICTLSCVLPMHSDNTVDQYSIDASGNLTEPNLPYIVATENPVSVIAVYNTQAQTNSGGLFVYVGSSSQNAGTLSPFYVCTVVGNSACTQQQVNASTMVPLQNCATFPCVPISPSAAGVMPILQIVDPTNSFLYSIANGSNQVYGFSINRTTGVLSALSTPNISSQGTRPVSMAMQPTINSSGQFLYVSNTSGTIGGFTLSATNGAISNPTNTIAPSTPSGMAAR